MKAQQVHKGSPDISNTFSALLHKGHDHILSQRFSPWKTRCLGNTPTQKSLREFPMFCSRHVFFSLLFSATELFWHPKHVTTQICHRYQTPVVTQKVFTFFAVTQTIWICLMFSTAMKFRVQFQPFFGGEKFELCTKKCLQKWDFLNSVLNLLLGVNHLGKFLASLGILQRQRSTLSRLSRPGEMEQFFGREWPASQPDPPFRYTNHSFPTLIRPYILNLFISKWGVRQLGVQ